MSFVASTKGFKKFNASSFVIKFLQHSFRCQIESALIKDKNTSESFFLKMRSSTIQAKASGWAPKIY